jgi:hypothetical protein
MSRRNDYALMFVAFLVGLFVWSITTIDRSTTVNTYTRAADARQALLECTRGDKYAADVRVFWEDNIPVKWEITCRRVR